MGWIMGECLPFPPEHTAGATAGNTLRAWCITRLLYTGSSCSVPLKGSMPCHSISLPSLLQEQLHSLSQGWPRENQMNHWKDLWLLGKEVCFKNTEPLSSTPCTHSKQKSAINSSRHPWKANTPLFPLYFTTKENSSISDTAEVSSQVNIRGRISIYAP